MQCSPMRAAAGSGSWPAPTFRILRNCDRACLPCRRARTMRSIAPHCSRTRCPTSTRAPCGGCSAAPAPARAPWPRSDAMGRPCGTVPAMATRCSSSTARGSRNSPASALYAISAAATSQPGAKARRSFQRAMFANARRSRAVVNVGGIANLTSLPARGTVTGFDCGPGNCLLDAWIREKRRKRYDARGAWAARGRVIAPLLAKLLAHSFFRRRPPKSTGREEFNLSWVKRALSGRERAADVQATLTELTAVTIARAVRRYCAGAREVFVCGGGSRNRALLARLAGLLPRIRVATTAALGIEPQHVEALAFAWLARQALRREPGNLPAVTGARGLRVLGAIYPK